MLEKLLTSNNINLPVEGGGGVISAGADHGCHGGPSLLPGHILPGLCG